MILKRDLLWALIRFENNLIMELAESWKMIEVWKRFEKCLDGTRKGWQYPSFRGDAAEIL